MAKYDISIIIPVYNVANYLEKCIESVRNQSKENIEIICIDDNSTDGSLQILEKASSEDNRVRVIKNVENRGGLYSRKCGVMEAEGIYIMFLDGDDFFLPETCEMAYSAITEYNTDVLHFGTNIINKGDAPGFEVDSIAGFVKLYENKLIYDSVLEACFIEEKYGYNLWNKIYKTSLCKKAFLLMDDGYYSMAEDMLAYFVLAYFAESYMGISEKLYNYNFAIGVSRPGRLDLDGLDKRCCGADSIAAVKRFLNKQETFEQYEKIYKRMERRILSDNFDAWYYRLPFEERDKGYTVFERHWGKDKVILGLLYDIENKQFDINQKERIIEEKNNELESRYNELEDKKRQLEEQCLTMGELNRAHTELLMKLESKDEEILQKQNEIEALKMQTEQLGLEIIQIRGEKEYVEGEFEHTLRSLSYKVGRVVTWIPRMIARGIRKIAQW